MYHSREGKIDKDRTTSDEFHSRSWKPMDKWWHSQAQTGCPPPVTPVPHRGGTANRSLTTCPQQLCRIMLQASVIHMFFFSMSKYSVTNDINIAIRAKKYTNASADKCICKANFTCSHTDKVAPNRET